MASATTDRVGQELLLEVWQQHCYSKFVMKDAKAALTTMSDNPYLLMVPIAIGGRGRDGVYKFYHDSFLAQLPADIRPTPISQVVGKDILAEEAVYQFTHDRIMDWIIPGVPATDKQVEVGSSPSSNLKTRKSPASTCTGIMPAYWPNWASSIRPKAWLRASKARVLCLNGLE
jgi:carboxymethylenebutenolidase